MSIIKLNNEQQVAHDDIMQYFIKNPKPYWILTGYAGTGKTTLLSHILKSDEEYYKLKESKSRTAVLTLTWKASIILHRKGITQAQSIHSFLYCSEWNETTKDYNYTKKTKKDIQSRYDAIIIDEASMVSKEIKDDLLATELPILFVGDPFQLPPVTKDLQELHFLDNADSKLVTIQRQALDNPIIELSMIIREDSSFNYRKYLGSHKDKIWIVNKSQMNLNWLINADQVICGTNASRIEKNNLIRQLLGYDVKKFPDINEKLIALSNYKEKNIYNGTLLYTDKSYKEDNAAPVKKRMVLRTEEGKKHIVKCVFTDLFENKDDIRPLVRDKQLIQVALGSVITCHKAQGSQWNNITILNEPFGTDIDKRRWQYTALTRAVDKAVILV